MNLPVRCLILIVITTVLSYGFVTLINNSAGTTEIPRERQETTFQTDQSGGLTGESASLPVHSGKPDRDGGASFAMVEIGKNLGIITAITLLVGLLQFGIGKIPRRKQESDV